MLAMFFGEHLLVICGPRNGQVDFETSTGRSALGTAAMVGDIKAITELVMQRAEVNLETSYGRTPLIQAVLCKQQKAIATLLQMRATAETMTKTGQTAITYATSSNNTAAMKLLTNNLQP